MTGEWALSFWTVFQRWCGAVALLAMAGVGACAQDEPVVEVEEVQVDVFERDVLIVDGAQNRAPDERKKLLRQSLEPILKSELYFLFMVTGTREPDREEMLESAQKDLEKMDDMLIDQNGGNGLGMVLGGATGIAVTSNGLSLNANPYTRIRDSLQNVAAQHLSPEEIEKYKTELAKRIEFRREATIGMVVQLLDQHLELSVEQRDQIKENLTKRWSGWKNISVESYLSNSNYIPVFPFPLIDTVLNRDQRTVWKTLNQYHFPIQINNDQFSMEWGF